MKYLHHSLGSVLSTLQKDEFASIQEVKDLLLLFSSHYRRDAHACGQKKMFIVVEGLDGSGKSTVTKKIAKAINGRRFTTPPYILKDLRPKFDCQTDELRRAYYALGNYVAADEIEWLLETGPVVLDRFWHSTAVFTIATELEKSGLGLSELPPVGNKVYCWPHDLVPIPDYVFYLDVAEHVRLSRLSRRLIATDEEDRMKKNKKFRTMLEEAYFRMQDPAVTVINANQPVKRVVNDILNFMNVKTDS